MLTRQILDPQTRLTALAEPYVPTAGGRPGGGKVDAKQRELACFLSCDVQLDDHDDRREWDAAVDNLAGHA